MTHSRPHKDDAFHSETPNNPVEFAENMAKAAEQCQKIMQEFFARQTQNIGDTPFDPLNVGNAFMEFFTHMASNPEKLWENQLALWEQYLQLWQNAAERAMGEEEKPFIEPDKRDRRFKDEAWQENVVFDFIKQSYLLTAKWMQHSVQDVSDIDPKTARKIDFYTRQFVDAMSPSNFLMTNPQVLKATLESKGENLVKGFTRLLEDLEHSKGNLRISMTDYAAFKVGENLATTPGKVIYQNELMQLIQYEPTTKQVHKTPLLIISAWINKYYILDLQEENSMVKYLVDNGYTVFAISWVNPDKKLSKKTFDDYMSLGPLAALDAIEQATGETEVSIGAYCLGGTLTSITLAWLKAKKQSRRVKSVTYLTTMIDFSDAGELAVFIDDEQLQIAEAKMAEHGFLEGSEMAMTFNMLRANDLIWSFVVNNYLLGKDPFPFDLLYWNADCTRMPAAMHSFYLRNMYLKNLLIEPGGITVAGVPIDLTTIDTPTYMLSTREDHIAPWQSTYVGTQTYKGDVRFVLAASGHIAGVINPPAKNKYCYWVNEESYPESADEWVNSAKEIKGSWWPDWLKWHQPHAGSKVDARIPGEGTLKPIEEAPGSYVKVIV